MACHSCTLLLTQLYADVAKSVDNVLGTRMMLAGMPNVGKSSLLNAMRRVGINKGKAAKTGGQPGVTRNIGMTVKISEDPNILLIDTPGKYILITSLLFFDV